jgi:uncharacterized protein YjbJ (UPF0337 family)
MNWDQMKGNWKEFSGKVREKWGDLTDDELESARGRRDQFEGTLQKKYGWAKEQAQRELDDFEKSCSC